MTCAKREVFCVIVRKDPLYRGQLNTVWGTNWCQKPRHKCPREEGEDYTKCKTVCNQPAHAEINALERAKAQWGNVSGSMALVIGHHRVCSDCIQALESAGIQLIGVTDQQLSRI